MIVDSLNECTRGIEAYTVFMELIYNTVFFQNIDQKLVKHISECKQCKLILKKMREKFKKNLIYDSEKLEELLHELNKLVYIFCTLEEIYGEFWDEERYGSLEKAQKRLEELRKIEVPSSQKLLERIKYRQENPFPIELQEEIAESLHKKTGISLDELRNVLIERKGILVRLFCNQVKVWEDYPTAKTAGVSNGLPPNFPITDKLPINGEEISLVFESNPDDNSLEIGLLGGKSDTRKKINIKVFYYNQQKPDEFEGKELIYGGVWSIPSQKAQYISQINFTYKEEKEEK